MKAIEILMTSGCTKADAERHLRNGATIFEGEDFERNFDSYMGEWGIEGDELAEYKAMVETKKPVPDWGIAQFGGRTWYIMYEN